MYVGVEIWGRHRGVCRSGAMGEAQRWMWGWRYGGGTEVYVGDGGGTEVQGMGEAQRCIKVWK